MSRYPVSMILAGLPKPGFRRPGAFLVAIDGGSGSGKSTLAAEWMTGDPAAIAISMDDFYLPVSDEVLATRAPEGNYRGCFDFRRMERQVLEPLRLGSPARYQSLDWNTMSPGDWRNINPADTVLIEGVYALRPEWKPFFDLRIWISVPAAVRLSRTGNRGTDSPLQAAAWEATEQWYLRNYRPDEDAHLVLDGVSGAILDDRR